MEESVIEKPSTVRENILQKYKEEKQTSSKRNEVIFREIPKPIKKQYLGKRLLDLFLGGIAFIGFLIAAPFIALGIKFSSPGKVIFKQKRTGLNGHVFTCYKFRTMHEVKKDRNEGEPDITIKGDDRIFTFGSFLRRTNLDELPQILNVMKGDMSLIGPRPYPVDECKHWNNTFEDFYYRYMVKPGVTGLAQVTGFRGGTLDVAHMRKRLDRDLIYIQKQSVGMDLKVLFMTVKQMVTFNTNAH
jgi:lipopolysaccharide/colanic/teichoic acid biosynthesis glycosyltransferase